MRVLLGGILALSLFIVPALAQTGETAFGSGDLNKSGFVDADDLLLMIEQWHTEGIILPPPAPDTQVNSEIISATIPADLHPVVTLTLKDDAGQPISPDDLGAFRFLIARIIEDDLANHRTHYENYFFNSAGQATYDSGGDVTDLGDGVYTYRFSEPLENVDMSLTHTIAVQIEYERNGVESVANPIYNWVPNGDPVTVTRETSTTATCNNCHDPLALHGGGRQEYVMCLTCHTPGVNDPDTGNTVDMKVLIHKIHMGEALPSVESGTPYQIIGYRGSVHDYSDVVFPQDHRNCTTCHNGPDADLYKLAPSRAACGSCHDDIDFENGVGHIQMTSDAACFACHPANMTNEFDNSVPGAHTIPTKSAQLPGYNAEIIEITGAAAGATPTVTFKLYQDDMTPVDIADADRVRIRVAGPTSDYTTTWQETVTASAVTSSVSGTYSYALADPLPADAEGTWGFAIETRIVNTIKDANGADMNVTYVADNVVGYAAVTGNLEPRRTVVDQAACESCHDRLALHGGSRNQVEYCVMCHNPVTSDEEVRPATYMPPVTVDFKVLIHKIHSGEHLPSVQAGTPYIVYGHNSSLHDYSDVLYPGNLANCEKCHVNESYIPPAPAGAVNTVVTEEGAVVSSTPPTTSACTSCHDSAAAIAHATSNTGSSNGVEACAVCHGEFRSEAVNVVHGTD